MPPNTVFYLLGPVFPSMLHNPQTGSPNWVMSHTLSYPTRFSSLGQLVCSEKHNREREMSSTPQAVLPHQLLIIRLASVLRKVSLRKRCQVLLRLSCVSHLYSVLLCLCLAAQRDTVLIPFNLWGQVQPTCMVFSFLLLQLAWSHVTISWYIWPEEQLLSRPSCSGCFL